VFQQTTCLDNIVSLSVAVLASNRHWSQLCSSECVKWQGRKCTIWYYLLQLGLHSVAAVGRLAQT